MVKTQQSDGARSSATGAVAVKPALKGKSTNGSGIKPLMSVRPVLPPGVRHLFSHQMDPGPMLPPPPMFPTPHHRMCLQPGPHPGMRRGLRPYPPGLMGHGPLPPPPPRLMCPPPPFFGRPQVEKYRRTKQSNANGVGSQKKQSGHGKSGNSEKPSAQKQGQDTEKPWVNEAIIAEILLKHKLQQTARRNRGVKDWNAYREQRNKVTAMLRAAKMEWMADKKSQEMKGSGEGCPSGSSSGASTMEDDGEASIEGKVDESSLEGSGCDGDSNADLGTSGSMILDAVDFVAKDVATNAVVPGNDAADVAVTESSGDNSPGSAKE